MITCNHEATSNQGIINLLIDILFFDFAIVNKLIGHVTIGIPNFMLRDHLNDRRFELFFLQYRFLLKFDGLIFGLFLLFVLCNFCLDLSFTALTCSLLMHCLFRKFFGLFVVN